MKTQQVYTVLVRLVRFNSKKSILVELFDKNSLPLEHLGVDLFNVFKSEETGDLYLSLLTHDLFEMNELENDCYNEADIVTELQELINELQYHIEKHQLMNTKLINLHLMGADTLVMEYLFL